MYLVQKGVPCLYSSARYRVHIFLSLRGSAASLTFRLQSSSSVARRVRLRRPNWTKIEIKKSSKTREALSHTVGRQVRRQPSGNIWRVSTRYGYVLWCVGRTRWKEWYTRLSECVRQCASVCMVRRRCSYPK